MRIKKLIWYLTFKLRKDISQHFLEILFISFTIFIFNILLILFFNFGYKGYNFFKKEYKDFAFEIFIDNNTPEDSLYKLTNFLNNNQLVKEFEYIDQRKAITQINSFLGWDISNIIKTNNIPSSYRIWLNINYKNLNLLNRFFKNIQQCSFININKEFINTITYWFSKIKSLFYIFILFGLGFIITIIISLYALINNIFKKNHSNNIFFKFYGFNVTWNIYSFYIINFIIFILPMVFTIIFISYLNNIEPNIILAKKTLTFISGFNLFLYLLINKITILKT